MKDATCVTIPPPAVVAAVLRQMAEGKTVKEIREMGLIGEDDNPYLWKQVDPSLAAQIEQVQRAASELLADQVLDVARDFRLSPKERQLGMEARKWLAEKYNPERFSSKPALQKNVDEMDNLTIEQIEARKAELLEQVKKELARQEKERMTLEGASDGGQ